MILKVARMIGRVVVMVKSLLVLNKNMVVNNLSLSPDVLLIGMVLNYPALIFKVGKSINSVFMYL